VRALVHEHLGQLVLERHQLPVGNALPRLPKLMDSSLPAFSSRLIWSLDFPASLPNSGTGRLFGDS
jgi:hypothetical protein